MSLKVKMPSSFLKRSPLKVVTPCKYSIGLVNMVECELMGIVFTNIFQPGQKYSHKDTKAQNIEVCDINLTLWIILKTPWLVELSVSAT